MPERAQKGENPMKNKTPRKKPAVNRIYYIYVGILAVLFFTFHTIPFLKGVMYSFTDWKGYGDWNFVGLRNYIRMCFKCKNQI